MLSSSGMLNFSVKVYAPLQSSKWTSTAGLPSFFSAWSLPCILRPCGRNNRVFKACRCEWFWPWS